MILIHSTFIHQSRPLFLLHVHFSQQVYHIHGLAGAEHWHGIVSQFYDVSYVSIKSAIFPEYMQSSTSIKNYVDPILPSGHDLITDILVAYMQTRTCTAWSVAHGNAFDSVPVHTPGDSRDGHALFGGVGQRKAVPEPNAKNGKEIDVDKKPMKDPHHSLINAKLTLG